MHPDYKEGVRVAACLSLVLLVWIPACRCSRNMPNGQGDEVVSTASFGDASAVTGDAARVMDDPYGYESFEVDLATTKLRVVDVHMSRDIEGVLQREGGATAVINGGFFDPEQKPLGLAMSEGQVLSAFRKSTGGVLLVSSGKATLFATESFVMPKPPVGFGIQCLPRLVVAGEQNISRDDGKHAERTALCVKAKRKDGDGGEIEDVLRFVYAHGSRGGEGPTLAQLSAHLTHDGCRDALNLDGGPSAGFAYRKPDGHVAAFNPRGAVRHVIVASPSVAASAPPP